jgi:hypothetical protein
MKMLIPALAFAIVIVAPGLTEPADARAAARKTEPPPASLAATAFSPGKTRNVIGVGNATSSTMKIPGFTIEARSSTKNPADGIFGNDRHCATRISTDVA